MDNSVGVFKNVEDNALILVPLGIDKYGVSRGLKQCKIVNPPLDPDIVGAKLRECFNIIESNEYTMEDMKDVDIKRITGDKSERKFTNRHLFQIVFLVQNKYFEFEPKVRNKHCNGYTGKGEVSEKLPRTITEEELGKAVLKTFKMCN